MFEQVFKNVDDIFHKDAGCSSELDYTEQSSWMLFLKYLDDLEFTKSQEAELMAEEYQYIIDEKHRWSAWAAPKTADGQFDHDNALTGSDLMDYVDGELFPYLKGFKQRAEHPNTIEYKIGEIFGEIRNKFASGYSLRDALEQCAGQTLHVIISVAFARLTHVSLTRKQARHLQRVLPYLLEEQMLDSPESLWFVSRKGAGDDYEVTAIARELIVQLKQWAAEQGAVLGSLQVDAERLQGQAPLIAELDETTGAIRIEKTSSTPDDPMVAILNGIEQGGIDLSKVSMFSHGTTVATNALITRNLPRTAMICTEGFRDVVERRIPSVRDGLLADPDAPTSRRTNRGNGGLE